MDIEKDYIDCQKIIDLNEYRQAKKEMEDYAERIFNDDDLDEIIESLVSKTAEDSNILPF